MCEQNLDNKFGHYNCVTEANLTNIDWTDIETKEVQIYKGHTGMVSSVAFSPSGEFLASGRQNTLRFARLDNKNMECEEWKGVILPPRPYRRSLVGCIFNN